MSLILNVTLEEFYQNFPEFKTEEYAAICPVAFRQTKAFVSLDNIGRLTDDTRKLAFYLMCAHLSLLSSKNKAGQITGGAVGAGMVASASVGEVSVSYVQIPNMDIWDYWLAQTPYGLELLGLLNTYTAVPFYVGGSLERVF